MYKKNEFKSRLAALGKKQIDLYEELNKRGYDVKSINQLYQYINEYTSGPKAETVLCACMNIVFEWEKKVQR